MYATFEEFIDHQQSPGEGSPISPAPNIPPPPAPSGGLGTAVANKDARAVSTNVSSTMNSVHPLPLPSPAVRSLRLPSKSPLKASDDLALASPRRSRKRRSRRLRRSVDNPLLDTISSISVGDSDEEPHHYRSHGHNLHHHHLHPHNSPSFGCCSRLHPETDSIGYAGSNSVDSGYKSACPTPDLSDGYYIDYRLEKRGSLASLASSGSSGGSTAGSKPRIAMGTRVMARGGGVPRSPSSGLSITPTRRLASDSSYYELDQLAALRHALLGSPTQECEEKRARHKRYSPIITSVIPRETHISRRTASSSSPERRPRSASTGSRYSPSTKAPRKVLQSVSPTQSSTGSLPRTSPPLGRRLSLSPATREEYRAPSTWSRHSSPGIIAQPVRGRRPPSPIVGVEQNPEKELSILEQEIDALLYGDGKKNSQCYVSEVRTTEYPYSYNSSITDQGNFRSSTGSFRRLREERQLRKVYSYPSDEVEQRKRLENMHTSNQSLDCVSLTSVTKENSHVTQCVLAMLNDLTCTMEIGKPKECDPASVSVARKRYRRTPFPRDDYEDSSDSDSCSSCCSEYHLYEEIIYGDNKQCPVDAPRPPSPPPLPVRPSSLLLKGLESENTFRSTKASPSGQHSSGVMTKNCYRCMCHSRMQRGFVSKSSSKETPYINKDTIAQAERESQKMAKLKSFFGESPPPTPPIRTTSQHVFICPKVEELVQSKCDIIPSSLKTPIIKDEAYPAQSVQIPVLEGTSSKNCETKPPPPPRISSSNGLSKQCARTSSDNTMDIINSTAELLPSHSSRPKQRNNIYSIFKERHCRRFVSDSLEKECEDQVAQLVTLDIQCVERCERKISCSTKLVIGNRPNSFQASSLSVNPVRKSSLPNSLSVAANSCVNIGQLQIAPDVSSHHTPKANEETLHVVKPNRIVTCSIDANQQYEDEYGFYPLPHIV